MRILLVEDDAANVELFVDILEGAGHTIVVERDGTAGCARGLTEPFELILLDIQLPLMPGDEVCRRLREGLVETPIVALSANALPRQVDLAMKAGFTKYLTKPISPAALRTTVEEVATGARPTRGE